MDWALIVTAIVVIVAIGFDFTNGFHDAANASRPQRRSRLLPSSTSSVPSSVTGPAAELPRPSKASRLRQVAMQVWPWLPLHLVVPSVGTWSPGDSVCPVHPHTR